MAVTLGLDPYLVLNADGEDLTVLHAVLVRAQELRSERQLGDAKTLAALIAERVGKLFG